MCNISKFKKISKLKFYIWILEILYRLILNSFELHSKYIIKIFILIYKNIVEFWKQNITIDKLMKFIIDINNK